MCAICGVYSFKEKAEKYKDHLLRANNIMSHRGPDGEGYFFFENIGFAHKRLVIIDEKSGNQPMFNEDHTVVVIFNGEIYNFKQLRSSLEEKGHFFSTNSDTEVLLHLYEEKGENLLSDLDGMFAFAIFDMKKKKLFLARDRFGIKPLYYKIENDKLIFASEIKAILAFKKEKGILNRESLVDYLALQYIVDDKTLFLGINKLLPGEYLVFKENSFHKKIYWNLTAYKEKLPFQEYFKTFHNLFQDSVKNNLQSDVPLGFHVSGGVDTASVIGTATSFLQGNTLNTYSSWFSDENDKEEAELAEYTAKYFHTHYTTGYYTSRDFLEILPKAIWFLDEPVGDPGVIAQFFTNRLASKKVKVLLSGHGADETLGGYARHLLFYFDCLIKEALQGNTTQDLMLPDLYHGLPFLADYKDMINKYFSNNFFNYPVEKYLSLVLKTENYNDYLSEEFKNSVINYNPILKAQNIFTELKGNGDLFDNVLYFDTKVMLPPLLQMEDRMSMANSLETRVPFLDHKLIEFAFKTPTRVKLSQGILKSLVREGLKSSIPPKIRTRLKKVGRPVPFNSWLKEPLFKKYIKDILLSDKAKSRKIFNPNKIEELIENNPNYSRKLWGFLCIEIWHQMFVD